MDRPRGVGRGVNDLVLHRGADGRRERPNVAAGAITLERRLPAGLAHPGLRERVKLAGRHAGRDLRYEFGQDVGQDLAALAEGLDLVVRLQDDHMQQCKASRRLWQRLASGHQGRAG